MCFHDHDFRYCIQQKTKRRRPHVSCIVRVFTVFIFLFDFAPISYFSVVFVCIFEIPSSKCSAALL